MTLIVGDNYIHDDYLVYAVSYGIIDGLGYTSLVEGLLIFFFRVRESAFDDPFALAIYIAGLGVIVAVAVNSMTDHMNSNRWYFNVIWSVTWYSYFCSRAAQTLAVRGGIRSETAIAGTEVTHEKYVSAFT